MKQALRTPQQELDAQMAQALSVNDFPMERLPEGFKELFHKALPFNSKMNIGSHALTWRNFILFERPFKMTEMALALDVMERATPVEMGQSLIENEKMLWDIIYPIRLMYDEMEAEIEKPIAAKINAQVKISNSAPIGKKLFKKDGSEI